MTAAFFNPYRFANFTPDSIAGLAGWWKGDGTLYQDSARTTLATADGDPVGSWSDESGNGKHAAQATSTKRPLLKLAANGINGVAALKADGVDDEMVTSLTTAFGDITVFVVFLDAAGAGLERLVDKAYSTGFWTGRNPSGAPSSLGGGVLESGSPYGSYVAATDGTQHILMVMRSGTTKDIRVDGGAATSSTVSGLAMDSVAVRLWVAADASGRSNSLIGEVLIYSAALSAGDRQSVETYLKAKWGTP